MRRGFYFAGGCTPLNFVKPARRELEAAASRNGGLAAFGTATGSSASASAALRLSGTAVADSGS